jgi:L-ascorbate metabolism protein UlaG (beta-lactamase superfamily)
MGGNMQEKLRVTYLNHSGFLVEWPQCYWIFDYYKGSIPPLDPAKPIFVFSSHSHHDHFNPEIFGLSRQYPSVTYVFANEIRASYRKLARTQQLPEAVFLPSGTDTQFSDGAGENFSVHTLISTDCGCAFVLTYRGRTIYHAGDLHWWTWPGESEQENRDMAGRYKKEIRYLQSRPVDLAFSPLDPRQEQDYGLGMNYLLAHAAIRHIVPMHFWNDFSIQEKYLQEYTVPEGTTFHTLTQDGQSWEIFL